ncbi:hypothetical protein F7725_002189 [Dissostichus mawsoni]|uniref:Rab-GAP TBC domain-containing protein n=1 Tax=Dissostichus mawsoni TaxID=36200 RepID=A0A7J5Y1Z6_DISMA|nr:hypothetical protein F7725_002189 [Dissostichus mawsoni]
MQHPGFGCCVSELLPLSPSGFDLSLDPLGQDGADYRALWKTAIHQQILLLRMEKENQRLEASRDELHIRKMKLNYQEVGQCSKEAQALWERKLSAPAEQQSHKTRRSCIVHSAKVRDACMFLCVRLWEYVVMNTCSCICVSGKIQHHFLFRRCSQEQARGGVVAPFPSAPAASQAASASAGSGHPIQDLLKQLTAQQHSILVDLGRTFPNHQYFSAQLGAGQLSLYNLLKAYSLLDTEVHTVILFLFPQCITVMPQRAAVMTLVVNIVFSIYCATQVGYCQGISFVAGVLLLHMSEEQAFDMLKYFMYDLGIRQQFRPDMVSLQVQMYQLSRLLHDYHRELYNHFEEHEICPSLYAAPWFLTLFASQFPLNFVSRVFDFVFVQGTGVIFKVALCLLGSHKGEIVECDSFESIVDYLKTTLPALTQTQMEQTMAKVMEIDISKQLHAYEVEYHVLQDEMLESGPLPDDSDRLDKLEKTNVQLKKQNMELLENFRLHGRRFRHWRRVLRTSFLERAK